MSSLNIEVSNITSLHTEAIVNAANSFLVYGGGVCKAVFNAAGKEKLEEACNKIGRCSPGSAVITPGFALSKYIIHAVGPVYVDGKHGESDILRSAYTSALNLAKENGIHSIGFPLLSSGIFRYPKEEAWDIAIRACVDFLRSDPSYEMDIVFTVIDEPTKTMGDALLETL